MPRFGGGHEVEIERLAHDLNTVNRENEQLRFQYSQACTHTDGWQTQNDTLKAERDEG